MTVSINKFQTFSFLMIGLLGATPIFGFGQLSISAVVRPRTELRHGFTTLPAANAPPSFFTSQRTRLVCDYKHEKADLFVSLQAVRIWGNQAQAVQVANAGVQQAWAEVHFSKFFHARLGRQEWIYDDHRLFGNLDWVQASRTHDALLLKFENKDKNLKIHSGLAYNQAQENMFGTTYWVNNYKVLGFVRAEKKFNKINGSLLHVSDGFEAPDSSGQTIYRQTSGGTVIYSDEKLQVRTFGYYQYGQDVNYLTRAAFFASAEVTYVIGKLNISGGYDIVSGNDGTDSLGNRNRAFHTLYPTNHKFYGYMDYFLDLPLNTAQGGLQDAYLKLKLPVKKKVQVSADAHYFQFAGKVLDPSDGGKVLSKQLGTEFDLTGDYEHSPGIRFTGGFSMMFGTDSMVAIKGGDKASTAYWSYLMCTINPVIFSGK